MSVQENVARCDHCESIVAFGVIEESAFVFCNIDCLTAHHSQPKGPSRFPPSPSEKAPLKEKSRARAPQRAANR